MLMRSNVCFHSTMANGFLFLVHTELLPVQSPRRLRLPPYSSAIGLLQRSLIVSEGLNIAPHSFDERLRHREWRPFRETRRLGRDRYVFADNSQRGCDAVREFDGVSHYR